MCVAGERGVKGRLHAPKKEHGGCGGNSVPQIPVHTEPQTVTLYGNRVFANIIR